MARGAEALFAGRRPYGKCERSAGHRRIPGNAGRGRQLVAVRDTRPGLTIVEERGRSADSSCARCRRNTTSASVPKPRERCRNSPHGVPAQRRPVHQQGRPISNRPQRVALLQNLAVILSRLHGLGVVVGDLSPKNLLFRLTPSPSCFLIDCDAMRVRGASVLTRCRLRTGRCPPRADRHTGGGRLQIRAAGHPPVRPVISPPVTRKLWPGCHPHSAASPRTASTSDHPSAPASRTGSRLWPRLTTDGPKAGDTASVPFIVVGAQLAPAKILGIFVILAAAILAIILVGLNIGSQPVSTSPPRPRRPQNRRPRPAQVLAEKPHPRRPRK